MHNLQSRQSVHHLNVLLEDWVGTELEIDAPIH